MYRQYLDNVDMWIWLLKPTYQRLSFLRAYKIDWEPIENCQCAHTHTSLELFIEIHWSLSIFFLYQRVKFHFLLDIILTHKLLFNTENWRATKWNMAYATTKTELNRKFITVNNNYVNLWINMEINTHDMIVFASSWRKKWR